MNEKAASAYRKIHELHAKLSHKCFGGIDVTNAKYELKRLRSIYTHCEYSDPLVFPITNEAGWERYLTKNNTEWTEYEICPPLLSMKDDDLGKLFQKRSESADMIVNIRWFRCPAGVGIISKWKVK